jgi:hypothetical protein
MPSSKLPSRWKTKGERAGAGVEFLTKLALRPSTNPRQTAAVPEVGLF